jgi:hypothetical protein
MHTCIAIYKLAEPGSLMARVDNAGRDELIPLSASIPASYETCSAGVHKFVTISKQKLQRKLYLPRVFGGRVMAERRGKGCPARNIGQVCVIQ